MYLCVLDSSQAEQSVDVRVDPKFTFSNWNLSTLTSLLLSGRHSKTAE